MRMIIDCYCCCSVAKSCLTLWPPGMQHARLLCPPLSPRVCSNACPSSRWYKWSHPLPPLSPFAFNSQVLSKASEGLSRAKKVTHFCSDGWISWKPPPQSCRGAAQLGWGGSPWSPSFLLWMGRWWLTALSVGTPAGPPVHSGGLFLYEWGGGGWLLGVLRRRAAHRAEQGIQWWRSLCLSGMMSAHSAASKDRSFYSLWTKAAAR